MKKAAIFIVAIAVVMSSCSDASKAKKLAQKYLDENSKTVGVKIAKTGELEEYTYVYDPSYFMKMDLELAEIELQGETDLMNDWAETAKTGDDYAIKNYEEHKSKAEEVQKKVEQLQKDIKNAQSTEYQIWKMEIQIQGKNTFGTEIKQDITMYFDKYLTKASTKQSDVIN